MSHNLKIVVDPFRSVIAFLSLIVWITGWVLAKGFWSTLFAVIFPPWGWYLIIEKALLHFGVF